MRTSEYLTTGEVASLLRVSSRAVQGYRARDAGPPFIKLPGGAVRYPRDELETWLTSHRRS
jgi:excisionase family DNA binding protein